MQDQFEKKIVVRQEEKKNMSKDNLWKDAEHQLKELDLDLDDEGGYNQCDAAANNQLTEDGHWEYWMRKNANEGKGDAVYNGLEYKPVSVMMPVPENDENPYWGWFVSILHNRDSQAYFEEILSLYLRRRPSKFSLSLASKLTSLLFFSFLPTNTEKGNRRFKVKWLSLERCCKLFVCS